MKIKLIGLAAVTLIAALMINGTAFAEGEVPQAPAAEEPVALPEIPATIETAPTAVTPLEEMPVVETPVIETAALVEIIEESGLEDQPIDEPVIQLVDTEGDALDRASQESAVALENADPYFTAGGFKYCFVPTAGTCAADCDECYKVATPIQTSMNYVRDNSVNPDGGLIYVEYATYVGNVIFDGSVGNSGALTGLMGVQSATLSPTISGSLTLNNLLNGFLLANFNITGGVFINNSIGQFDVNNVTTPITMTNVDASNTDGSGIKVDNHKGNITFTGVSSHRNNNFGATINNQAGGTVTINSSNFYDNNEAGLAITSSGTVTLNTVTANGNQDFYGVYIDTVGTVTLANIKANDNKNIDPFRPVSGIHAVSIMGAVNVNGAVANGNSGSGIEIYGRGITIRNAVARNNSQKGLIVDLLSGAGLLENVVANDNNGGVGVFIYAPSTNLGTVTLRNMTARNNAMGGIRVETFGAVTVTNSTTEDNYRDNDPGEDTGGDGMFIQTKGVVTLTTIWSSNNGTNGLFVQGIKNLVSGSEVMSSPTSITLTSPLDSNFANYFFGNGRLAVGGSGIKIISHVPVTFRNFTARENHGNGLYVTGPLLSLVQKRSGAVTIASTIPNWRNSAEGNDIGVNIYSTDAVSLSSLNSSENGIYAVNIDTFSTISLRDVNDWRNKGSNYSIGLFNDFNPSTSSVTINNMEIRESRGDSGAALEVHSRGAITISGLWLENNNNAGAALANAMGGKGSITLTNATIQNNANTGIQTFSNGSILFTNVRVQGNGSSGAQIYNTGALTAMPVTLTDCVFENNQGTGLEVLSKGLITLSGVEARWNSIRYGSLDDGRTLYEINQPDWGGVDEMTFLYTSGNPVTIILRSLDEWNSFEPIVELVDANGDVVSSDSTTDEDGVWTSIFNSGTLPTWETYTIRVLFDDSFSNGFGKYSLSINDPDELHPYIPADGVVLDNTYSTVLMPPGVLTSSTANHPYNLFEGNNGYGLNIKTHGVVTITNLYANNNAFGEGLYMNNPTSIGAVIVQNLAVTNPSSFSNNGGSGLYIRTRGAITLSNVEAFNNQHSGADLDNAICTWDDGSEIWTNCLGTGGITVKSPSGMTRWFNDNRHFGIWAVSKGAITLTNISAKNDGWDGAFLWNDGRNSTAAITVNTSGTVRNEFNDNARNTDSAPWFSTMPVGLPSFFYESEYYWARLNGLTAMSGGTISILNTNANWNQNGVGVGIIAITEKASTPKTVLISSVETSGNDWIGIWVRSSGAITLTKVTARDNGFDGGIHLDNALCTWDDINEEWTNCLGTGAVTMTTIAADNNRGKGLDVYSRGLITLNGASVYNNWDQGIHLENNFPGTMSGITMTKITANDNWATGLEALSRGAISLIGGDTSNNGYYGTWLENKFEGVLTGITISSATANNNHNTGIAANTNGALTMANMNAHNNNWGKGGINEGETVQDFVNKGGDRWYFSTETAGSYEFTLQADSYESLNRKDFDPEIVLYDLDDNPIDISSSLDCVTNDHCIFTYTPGVESEFYVIVSSTNGDGFYRLSLNDNNVSDDPDQKFWVSGLNFNAGGNVILNGNNSFNGNSLTGIFGNSGGNISVANVGAFSNGTEGISLDNKKCAWDEGIAEWVCTGTGSITMSGTNIANNNGWEGLRIETRGIVAVTNLDASYNNHGDESSGTLASVRINAEGVGKTVTLTNITAMHNRGDGLDVRTEGIATLNNMRAWLNGRDGANVNAGITYPSIMRNSSFIGNDRYGIFVYLGQYFDYFSILLGNGVADFQVY